VVAAYRQVIDATPDDRAAAIASAKQLLKSSFGRPPTRGFLAGPQPTDMVNPSTRGATGMPLGKIEHTAQNRIGFTSRDPLCKGDRLRVQPASDRPGTGFTLRELYLGTKSVSKTPAGTRVSVGLPANIPAQKGDMVYKVASGQAYTLSESAGRKRLDGVTPDRTRVALSIVMPTNDTLQVAATGPDFSLTRLFPVEGFPAREQPLSKEILQKVFQRSGDTPFELASLACATFPPLVIPPSRLKTIRRDFYRELAGLVAQGNEQPGQNRRREALQQLVGVRDVPPAQEPVFSISLARAGDLKILKSPGIQDASLPLLPGALQRLDNAGRSFARDTERIVWELPLAIFDDQWPAYQAEVDALVERGFERFRLQNLGQFELFAKHALTGLETGYRLFTLNSQAALAWQSLGAVAATLYVEDDKPNIADLLARDLDLRLQAIAYANLPMMISRVPLRAVKADRPVLSDREEAYRVETSDQLTVLRPEQDFSLVGHLAELNRLGCAYFIFDLSHCSPFSPRGQQVLNAIGRDQKVAGTSPFNFTQGLT
jgi:putative protease